MTKYVIQATKDGPPNLFYEDANGWLQPDLGLALRYNDIPTAQAAIDAHSLAYGTSGYIIVSVPV